MAAARLRRGDLLPRMRRAHPGARSRSLAAALARFEAPGINTLIAGEPPLLWQEARGSNVLDTDGNRYLDFTSGFGAAAIGHRHPRVVAAVRRQAGLLLHGLGDVHAHPLRAALARALARRAPVDDAQVYFATSGAEAVEIALKTALLATRRPRIVAFAGGYHGLTGGALAVTARDEFRRPFAAHLHSHVTRLEYGCPPRELDAALAGGAHGAVLVEPILGREGIVPPPPGWLREVAALCRRHGTLFIADEIFTGFGRSGRWFALDHDALRADILCLGKALGGGLPIAAAIGRRDLFAAWSTPGEALHTSTFVAHPVACAAALATLAVLAEERLPQRAARLGRGVERALRRDVAGRVDVRAVRGRGLLWAIELASREAAHAVVARARGRGLLLLAGGPHGRVLQIAPPLSVGDSQLRVGLEILVAAL